MPKFALYDACRNPGSLSFGVKSFEELHSQVVAISSEQGQWPVARARPKVSYLQGCMPLISNVNWSSFASAAA